MISIDDINDYDNKTNKRIMSNNTGKFTRQSNNKRISFLESMNSSEESIVSPIECSSFESFSPIDNHKIPSISTKVLDTCTKVLDNPTLLDAIIRCNESIESSNNNAVLLIDLLIKNNQSMLLAMFELIETNKKNSNSLSELHHQYFKSERILRLQNAIQTELVLMISPDQFDNEGFNFKISPFQNSIPLKRRCKFIIKCLKSLLADEGFEISNKYYQNSDDANGQSSFRQSLCVYMKSIAGLNINVEKNEKGNYVLVEKSL